jgi:hypothetical protein
MNRPTLILLIGVVLLLVSLLADPLGIGTGGGWGWKQMTGMAVGVLLVVVGLVLRSRAGKGVSSA